MSDYWDNYVRQMLDEANLDASEEQILTIKDWVEVAHYSYEMAHSHDVANANWHAEDRRKKGELEQRLHYEKTVPRNRCSACAGHGYSRDGWGRDFSCDECGGKGSTPAYPFRYHGAAGSR